MGQLSCGIVNITWQECSSGDANLNSKIEQAFGPDALGILTVSNVSEYTEMRANLLRLADRFGNLPDSVKARCEDPQSSYNVGWSHGRESLEGGQLDTHKGSFYANPLTDTPSCSDQEREHYPSYFRSNVWPESDLPELEKAFKELGSKVIEVGMLLAGHCDKYVRSKRPGTCSNLQQVLGRSNNPKARLLHYFATPLPAAPSATHEQAWCGWHSDHGSLTGLTAAMYIKNGKEVPNPDPSSGLYIRDRHGNVIKATFPADCIAFQIGESSQIHSGGLLRATPHYVRAAYGPQAAGVSRNAFAVFMQPGVLEPMDCPEGVLDSEVAIGQWQRGLNFGQFSEATFRKYYNST